jgi:Chromo (CHRromatin Organisation MOdifier) domain
LNLVQGLCKKLNIAQNISTTYHPQTDGQSERANQCVEQYLHIYGNEYQNDWATLLPMAQFVHNTWPNATTGYTPFELLIGHTPLITLTKVVSCLPHITKRSEFLQELREKARTALKHAQTLLRRRTEHKKGQHHYRSYAKGERVWLEGMNLKATHLSSKLAPRRYGPFMIIKVISPVVVRLKIPDHWKIHNIFHTSLIALYTETPKYGPNYEQPTLEIIEGEPEYEVEHVLAFRHFGRGKKLQYLLKWKGYSAAHNSWEPTDNISAPELLWDFYKANPMAIKALGI